MRAALRLAPRLALNRLSGTRGGAVLDMLAVIAYTVAAFLSLTVAGGMYMFVRRWQRSIPVSDEHMSSAIHDNDLLQAYVVLALVACVLLVVPVLNLGAAAARLGARGRDRRLASLRLLGMSGRQVVLISTVETLVQAAAGTLIGCLLWLASLPAWHPVTFQGHHIAASVLLMPWWLIAAIIAGLLLLAVLSTAIGLQQVRISPLGVATQQSPRALRVWRFIVFACAIVAFIIFGQLFSANVAELQLSVYAFVAGMILLVVGAVNLVGPWVLQLLARPAAVSGSVPRLIAARRIIDDPRAAWRNVSAIALLGMIAAFIVTLPTDPEAFGGYHETDMLVVRDMQTGAIITLAIGLTVAATSTLVNQGALVLERAGEGVAMDRAGFPRRVFDAIRRRHVFIPLIVTLAISIGVGLLLATPFMTLVQPGMTGATIVIVTIIIGLILNLAAAEACRPLQRRVLSDVGRRND